MKLLKCPICGNVVEVVEDHGVPVMCCGKPMVEIKAGEVDAAVEKHVPVVKVESDYLVVTVGEVLHPMTAEHLISNIWVEFSDGSAMKVTLTAEDEPIAKFNVANKKVKLQFMNIVIFMDCGKQKLIYRPPYKLEVFILVRFKNKRMLLDFILKTDNEIKK